ncbi:MAG: SDR family oxidoreductase [Flavobacteriales bacterium]|jgi:NAD(P)-dependent dehydrogenase (short-subunit alcohol dehydrogenase family)|nr:SDR family oxidoreductase [Flavobacteriales bacterium]
MHKNYLIIGGSTGIGLAIVNQLSKTGVNVISTYYQSDRFQNTPNYHYLNVLDNNYDLDFVPEQLDGIVYCPGSINLAPFKRITSESMTEDFELNVLGAFKVIQRLIPNLKKAKQGSIVLFSSVAAQNGFNFHSQVSTIKGAIEGFTKALAAELAPSIRVNAIAPSITQTPLASKLLNTEAKIEANANRHPLKKVGEADDIAHLATFLLTEKSQWITGQILTIDGGISSLKI